MAPQIRRLQIAVSGLGRMGVRHANHFLHRTPRAELVAAFTPDPKELAWAKENLTPWGVKIYSDFDEMLKHSGLEAVCVATATTAHAEQTIRAIEAGKHVLCEKPLSTKLEISEQVLRVANAHPNQKVMCGFSRRFDASYLAAYRNATSGSIGRPTILRSQTCDKYDPSGFFVAYAEFSGGIFVDCNIHDIDLALWFFSEKKQLPKVKSVMAVGVTALEPDLAKHGDVDNGVGVVEFHDGQIAYFYSSRMNAPGQHDMTEIIGTSGKLTVNANPTLSLTEAHTPTGISREIPQNYYERFENAFVEEARQFTDAVLDDKPVPVDMESSVEAVRIGVALQESLRNGRKIFFDRQGNKVEDGSRAKL
ncbi:NAD binding rossmann fold-containing protein [Paraphaeosphaeria minitans]|uniref:NAD binding rossmann fold-containing protein n=1 Tax=Paraphaeosphaeria minitans TaxID=565426 RepID=A0A9P6GMB2_9PLEO|nr:NAD binding rossmann fold-containing protein [Paraphaeosphaeria minitans]